MTAIPPPLIQPSPQCSDKHQSDQNSTLSLEKSSEIHNKMLKALSSTVINACEFYTKHNFMKGEKWMLTISKWPDSILTTYEIFNKEISTSLNTSNIGKYSFTVDNCFLNNIYIAFRPIDNFTKPSYWFNNNYIHDNLKKKIILFVFAEEQ